MFITITATKLSVPFENKIFGFPSKIKVKGATDNDPVLPFNRPEYVPRTPEDEQETVCAVPKWICQYRKPWCKEEKEFFRQHEAEMQNNEPQYRDKIWVIFNPYDGTCQYKTSPSFEEIQGAYDGAVHIKPFGRYIRRIAKVDLIDGKPVIRCYRLDLQPAVTRRNGGDGYFESDRLIFDGADVYRETRRSIWRMNVGMFTRSPQWDLFRQTWVSMDISGLEGTEIMRRNPWMNYLLENYAQRDLLWGSSVSELLLAFHRLPKRTGIYKKVPKEIREDLQAEHTCAHLHFNSRMESGDRYPIQGVTVERRKDILVFYGYDAGSLEVERLYVTPKKLFHFSLNVMTQEWISTQLRYSDIFLAKLESFICPSGAIACSDAGRLEFKELIKDSPLENAGRIILGADSQWCEHLFIVHMTITKILWAEQAAKMGFQAILRRACIMLYQNIHTAPGQERLDLEAGKNLPSVLEITGKQLKFLPKEGFDDRGVTVQGFRKNVKRFPEMPVEQRIFWSACLRDFDNLYKIREAQKTANSFCALLKSMQKSNPFSLGYTTHVYADYLKMREDAEKIGRFHYPPRIKMSELRSMHENAMLDYHAYHSVEEIQRSPKKLKAFQKAVHSQEYKRLEYKNDKFMVIAPETPQDLLKEGASLSHCVATYARNVAEGRSRIYFLRRTSAPSTSYYTISVHRYDDQDKLSQCLGYKNRQDKDPERLAFLEEWKAKKGLQEYVSSCDNANALFA